VTRSLGSELPDPLYAALSTGDPGEQEGLTFLLLSVREDGSPHLAMLSVGEVVALDRRRLRLALWPASTTTRNLIERKAATLAAVLEETGYTVRLGVRAAGELATPLAGRLARFDASVEEVGADVVPYAVLESGVRFRLKEPREVLPRWAEVRAQLRRDPAGG
jgi:hypothetical protein